jgi:hypothetical protein
MRLGRTILAIVVGLSVAMLPAMGGFAAGALIKQAASSADVSAAMPDCEHHRHAPSDKTKNTANDCASMAGCALKCFNFTGPAVEGIAFSMPAGAALEPVRAIGHVYARMIGAPFRPPRA